jgi:uncharacterized Zn finger protein
MSTILTLTQQDIRTFVGEQNFQKGQQLVRDGAIINPEQQGMMLKAYCYGSLPEPYRGSVVYARQTVTPETARGGVATHYAASTRLSSCL